MDKVNECVAKQIKFSSSSSSSPDIYICMYTYAKQTRPGDDASGGVELGESISFATIGKIGQHDILSPSYFWVHNTPKDHTHIVVCIRELDGAAD